MTDWQFLWHKYVLQKVLGQFPEYEPRVKEVVKRIKGNLFIDVGAHRGHYTILLHKHFRKVYMIEPDPDIQSALRLNLIRHGVNNATLFKCALSNMDGETEFYKHNVGGGGAQTLLKIFEYKPADPEITATWHGQSGVRVQVRRYDELIREEAALVKIDVEGAEFLILEGARKNLDEHLIRNLVIELHNRDRQFELETLLKGYGYTVRVVDRHPHLLASVA